MNKKIVLSGSLCRKDRRLAEHLLKYFLDHWKRFVCTFNGKALQHCVHQDKKYHLTYEEFNRHQMRNKLVILVIFFIFKSD